MDWQRWEESLIGPLLELRECYLEASFTLGRSALKLHSDIEIAVPINLVASPAHSSFTLHLISLTMSSNQIDVPSEVESVPDAKRRKQAKRPLDYKRVMATDADKAMMLNEIVLQDHGFTIAKLLTEDVQSDDTKIVIVALKDLDSLMKIEENGNLEREQENAMIFASLGGYCFLKVLMKKWIHHLDVLILALAVLIDVLCKDGTSEKRPFIWMGMLEQMLQMLEEHSENEDLVVRVCIAVELIINNSHHRAEHFVNKLAGITKMTAVMERSKDFESMQLVCAQWLKIFSFRKQFRPQIISSGGARLLFDAMQRFPNNKALQKEARSAIMLVMTQDDDDEDNAGCTQTI
ncbi:hypothetical protein MPSEU_000554700 [Mayamaea pseudoterrestris]|nr:hypothetical protein MPSEU_000554700 [Mayamaea pseudoterrestris]